MLDQISISINLTFLIFLIIYFILMTVIGIFVYNDAKKRRMNAELWLIIILLSGGLIGLIIYLFIKKNKKIHTSKKIK